MSYIIIRCELGILLSTWMVGGRHDKYHVKQIPSCRWAWGRRLGGWFGVRCSSRAVCRGCGAGRLTEFAARAQSLSCGPRRPWSVSSQRRWTCHPTRACTPCRSLRCRWCPAVWASQLSEAQPSLTESPALSTGTLSSSRLHTNPQKS
jgi:hypothetical protein